MFWLLKADLSSRGHGAGGDPHGVDAPVGVLVDFDVGSLPPGLLVSGRVEQIQHLFVVQLESRREKKKRRGKTQENDSSSSNTLLLPRQLSAATWCQLKIKPEIDLGDKLMTV